MLSSYARGERGDFFFFDHVLYFRRVFSNVFSVNLDFKNIIYPLQPLLLRTNVYKCVYIVEETELGVLFEGFAVVLKKSVIPVI